MTWLLESPFAQAIGMTLVHSIWQILLVAALFAIVYRSLARRSANTRYLVAYSALVLMLVLPLVTLFVVSHDEDSSPKQAAASLKEELLYVEVPDDALAESLLSESATLPVPYATELESGAFDPVLDENGDEERDELAAIASPSESSSLKWRWVLPWLSVAWSMGVIGFSLRPFLALRRCQQLRKLATPIEFPWIADTLEALCMRIGIKRQVKIANSALVHVPTVIGFFRPIILLPLSVISGQTPDEMSAIIAHELAHIRRHDFVFNLFQTAIETLLFYHPAVWWISVVVRQERENCCDDIAMAVCGRKKYATALANLEFARSGQVAHETPPNLAMAADGGSLYRRIHRIVRPDDIPHPLGRWLAALVAISTLLLTVTTVVPTGLFGYGGGQARAEGIIDSAGNDGDGDAALAEHQEAGPTRIHGRVLAGDDQGVAGKVYLVQKRMGVVTRPGTENVLRQVATDDDGRFDFSMQLPSRNDGIDRGVWNAEVLQLVAIADGYGPTATDVIDARKGEPVELRLPKDDVPIEGTIRTLEGVPVVGAKLRVAILICVGDVDKRIESLRQRAREQKPGQLMLGYTAVSDFLVPGHDLDANERGVGHTLHNSQFARAATTDANGHFRLSGVGRDRVLALELSGPGIVKSWISVITRDMQPIPSAVFHGGRTGTTYGAKFSYTVEPSQPIVGTITDVETGAPIEGVRIESSSGSGESGHVATITNKEGKYRLDGLPKSERYRLDITPPANAPYLSRRYVDVANTSSGLNPTTADFPLRSTKWYTGRIMDKNTGLPVAARVLYSPRIDNDHAEMYPAFVKGSFTAEPFDSNGDSVDTDKTGHFRIPVIPGDGMLFVRCDEPIYCTGLGQEAIDAKSKWWGERQAGESQRMTNTYAPMFPEWVHRMLPIKVLDSDVDEFMEITVDPGQTLEVNMVDAAGEPLSDVTIVGRISRAFELPGRPTDSDRIKIPAITVDNPRGVFFYHQERNLGAFVVVPRPLDAKAAAQRVLDHEQRTVRLDRCATVKGRLVDPGGEPLSDLAIGICPLELGDPHRRYVIARTDKEGYFENTRVIPGALFEFRVISSPKGEEISSSARLKPGEVLDFGEIVLDREAPHREPNAGFGVNEDSTVGDASANKRDPDAPPSFALAAAGAADATATVPETERTSASNRAYAGQVLLPDGQPAVGADIYLVHWFPTPMKKLPAKSLAKTDREGRFRFVLESDLDEEVNAGTLVAKKDGYAFAWALAPALEESGETLKKAVDYPPQIREALQLDREPMRLLADDKPVTGRVVDTEGNGVAGVSVYVSEVLGASDNTMAAVDTILTGTNPDYMKLQSVLHRTLRGPHVPTLLGATKTDQQGRFTMGGIGKDRIAKIVMQGAGIVAESVYARTSGGQTVVLPMESTQRDGGFQYVYHGHEFTLVAEPSRPIVGRVTDEAGKGVSGVVVTSNRAFSYAGPESPGTRSGSNDILAITDGEGKYRLEGLPSSRHNTLRFSNPVGADFLAATTSVDNRVTGGSTPRFAPVTKDVTLKRGLVVEGRVVDAKTGQGVAGHLRFIRPRDDGMFMASAVGSEILRSKADGSFRITIPKETGTLTFTAFQRHLYRMVPPEQPGDGEGYVEVVDGDVVMIGTSSLAKGHAVYGIQGTEEGSLRLDLRVEPASLITGHAIGPDGQRLAEVFYTGQSRDRSFWIPTAQGQLELYDFDTKQPRRVAVVHKAKKLAGVRMLESAEDGFRVKLTPWATVRGRIVDEAGEPLAGVQIRSSNGGPAIQPVVASPTEAMQPQEKYTQPLPLPPSDALGNYLRTATDEEGRFEIAGLVAGHTYFLDGQHQSRPFEFRANTFARDLKLNPGEDRDLGDVVLEKN